MYQLAMEFLKALPGHVVVGWGKSRVNGFDIGHGFVFG
jgi:hypothetical protein